MPSLRKRVSSYFRQLSFHNEPREKRNNFIENTFINKYLQGEIRLKEGPPIIYGKTPTDLPNYDLGAYGTGSNTIVGCYTGPCGGLTTVKRSEKHLSVLDQDIDFIDTTEDAAVVRKNSKVFSKPLNRKSEPLDNTTMVIKVAGQEYLVTNSRKRHNKSHSLGSLSDFKIEVERTKKIINNNTVAENKNDSNTLDKCDKICDNDDSHSVSKRRVEISEQAAVEKNGNDIKGSYGLGKSKSEGNPFGHVQGKTGKITRLTHRPTAGDSLNTNGTSKDETDNHDLPPEWRQCSEFVYGMSDSLYDKNLITKRKNGDPIADCFGIIARGDSAILAVADGVNWGEKACIAAKSAIHGCLHYLNKTLFLDTKPFDNLIKTDEGAAKAETPIHETRINNTREVFICLLRAFNCAHDLILENNGMLTTLTVAVVLPLKQSNVKSPKPQNLRKPNAQNNRNLGHRRTNSSPDEAPLPTYICCVCNVGDTLAYIYSQKYGVRELTKGSHDISCNRDMRDALGALGPVDGINPELSNLTLAITTIQKGDIVMIASDGLTDNFDPNVCKFTVNSEASKARKVSVQQNVNTNKENQAIPTKIIPPELSKAPIKPPRKHHPNRSSVESNKSVTINKTLPKSQTPPRASSSKIDSSNPLIAQFLQENSLDSKSKTSITSSHTTTNQTAAKKHHSLQKSSTTTKVPNAKPPPQGFLRSKTSVDLRSKTILRNPEGIPFVTPLQRYELTLLLMEDILKRGISGKENQCVTAKKLCENLISFTISITNAKRRTLEDTELYYNDQNGVLVELSQQEKKLRRRKGLEKVQNLPGKLDHVTVLAYNVGNSVLLN